MKQFASKICACFTGLLLLCAPSLQAQNLDLSDTGVRLDGIAAVVNDGLVLLSELEDQTAMIVQRLRADHEPQEVPHGGLGGEGHVCFGRRGVRRPGDEQGEG